MPWVLASTGQLYTGETHQLAGTTYSGATRTPESRRLVWADEVVPARTEAGQFVSDDPATPLVDESKRKSRPRKKAV